jgi:molybdate transport repressor ModE-like protein
VKACWKVWIGENGQKVFGKGPKDLLLKIDQVGSINKAAKEMGMSYSKAIRLINTIEENLGIVVLERKVGGDSGGGSVLTDDARKLIDKFEKMEYAISKEIEKIYKETF